MKRLLSLAACAAVLAVPVSVAAQAPAADPALNAFQKVCWASGGDYMASLKAADADGWTDTAVTGEDAGGVSVTDKAAKAKLANGASLTLLVSRGLQNLKDIGQVKVVTCKLAVSKPDSGLVSESKAWLGVAPDNPADPTLAVYYVKMAPGAPSHVSKDGLAGAINSGGLAILKFQQDSDGGILVYTGYSK
ncbi:MAG TPA: hypothetical protein VGF50_12245 [Caulobacteraceae bacterium]|jgi:hypothetical protein